MSIDGNSRRVVLDLLQHIPVGRVPCFSGMGNVTTSGLDEFGYRFAEIHVDAEKMAIAKRIWGKACATSVSRIASRMSPSATAGGRVDSIAGGFWTVSRVS